MLPNIKITIHENLFIKDPTSSELGQSILFSSIDLIDEMGLENFTFRKLGQKIHSPEASIYRYFENKNQLLSYITSWYWGWMGYQLLLETTNVSSAESRLENAIYLITRPIEDSTIVDGMNIKKMYRIIISESSKSYLTKNVDKANKEGSFIYYKNVVTQIAKIILEINPNYLYPNMLLSTIIEGAHLQLFFGEHLPSLTNKQKNKDYISKFYLDLAFSAIKKQEL